MSCLSLHTGYQPIPGYVLKDKLGSGGYGEVWSADAPGGLTKAIKFVFGSIDDPRGSTELRSLNRMRKLNHPFLLSIERVEVVDSQLVVVSELAQGSLLDRFLEYREKGFTGIPQERLLRYLADAAEGLDYLCQEHGLQHLDVKPGNLLLVADRVKVADFGLIKNLQSMTQSARNGLTPMYAAPEMFDGRPTSHSDQYSLAVAYVELLTGNLPFRGRTCAQLANEHLNKAPNLESVPVIERPVLAKALAKKPNLRFGSCREFIQAIAECRIERKTPANKLRSRTVAGDARLGSDPFKVRRGSANDHEKGSQPSDPSRSAEARTESKPLRLLAPLPPLSSKEEPRSSKVLYLGLGGTGGSVIQLLQMRLKQFGEHDSMKRRLRAMYIDTDSESVEQLTSHRNLHAIPHIDTITLGLNSSQYYRQCKAPDLNRVSRRWIYNIPRSQKTEGVRPLGMLAFLDNAKHCYETLSQAVEELFESEADGSHLSVYLMASAHGGTGGAIVLEIGHLIRNIAASLDLTVDIQILLLCSSSTNNQTSGLEVASAVACLEDIQKLVELGGLHEPLQSLPTAESFHQIPFDQVTLIHGGTLGNKPELARSIETMVEYAWSHPSTDFGMRLAQAQAKRKTQTKQDDLRIDGLWLKTVGCRQINTPSHADKEKATGLGCLNALNEWISLMKKQAGQIRALQRNPKAVPHVRQQVSWANELFRGQQLSASSWIRRVIAAFASAESRSTAAIMRPSDTREGVSTSTSDWTMSKEIAGEIEAITTQLNCDPQRGKAAVAELMHVSFGQLWSWLEKSVLCSLSGWTHLWDIQELIELRFEENIERIQSIANQLQEKWTAAEKPANPTEQTQDPHRALTLEALSLEIRFHNLGAKLQMELAQKVTDISNRWMRQSLRMIGEMSELSAHLMTELGVQAQETLEQPELAELIMNPYYCEATKFLSDLSYSRLADCWNLPSEIRRKIPPERRDLRGLTLCVKHSVNPSHENDDLADSQYHHLSTSQPQNILFQDPFGWRTIFGPSHPGDTLTSDSGTYRSTTRMAQANFIDEFRLAIPKLMECGGTIQNVLVIGEALSSRLTPIQRNQLENCFTTLIDDPVPMRCSVFSVGEPNDLSELIERIWPRNNNIEELAKRLRCVQSIGWAQSSI